MIIGECQFWIDVILTLAQCVLVRIIDIDILILHMIECINTVVKNESTIHEYSPHRHIMQNNNIHQWNMNNEI